MAFPQTFRPSFPYTFYGWLTRSIIEKSLQKPSSAYMPKQEGKELLYVAASCLPFHISGYTSRTHEILKALQHSGAKVQALTKAGYPWDRKDSLHFPSETVSERDGISYKHFRSPSGRKILLYYSLAASKVIEKYIIKNKIGRVHAASNHVNALPALIAAKKLGIPFQYEMRGLWELTRASRFPGYETSPSFRLGLSWEAFVAAHADTIFVISRQLGLYVAKNWHIDEKKIRLLPNCIDIDRIQPFSEITIQPRLLGYAGTLISYEGLDLLLEALAILKSQHKPIKLLLIGDGEARPQLEALSHELQIKDQVEFTGRLEPEAARKRLAEAAVICIPRKPFEVCKIVTPIKLIEAMAMGKPVICPDLPVFRDELGELAKGWTFSPGNAQSLAVKIEECLQSPDNIARQGDLLRKHAVNSRQWKQYVPTLLN